MLAATDVPNKDAAKRPSTIESRGSPCGGIVQMDNASNEDPVPISATQLPQGHDLPTVFKDEECIGHGVHDAYVMKHICEAPSTACWVSSLVKAPKGSIKRSTFRNLWFK